MKTFLELFSIHTYTTIFYGRSSWQLNVQVGFKIQYFYHKKMTKIIFEIANLETASIYMASRNRISNYCYLIYKIYR